MGLLLILYLFLWQLVAVIWRDLRRRAQEEAGFASPIARLVVVESGDTSYQPGHSFPIYGPATLGRGSDNTIVLSDAFVSTTHSALTREGGGWWLSDLGSRNGTLVNGERIGDRVRIREGDLVTIGQVKLKLGK